MTIKVDTYASQADDSVHISAKISMSDVITENASVIIMKEICSAIATRYVQDYYPEIASKLNQNAIASLSIAEAAKKIAEEIRLKPTIIHEKEVYQAATIGY